MSDFNKVVKGLEDKILEEEKPTQKPDEPKKPSQKYEIPHLSKVQDFLQKNPEYKTQGINEFKYDDGSTVLTGDIYKGDKRVARLEFDKSGKPINQHGQSFSDIDFSMEKQSEAEKQEAPKQEELYKRPDQQILDKGVHYKPTEKEQDYNDYYGAKTWSERELNLVTHNDERTYDFIRENKRHLLELADTDPEAAVRALLSRYSDKDHGITANNVSKSYLKKLIGEFEPDEIKKPMKQVAQTATPEQIASQEFGKPFTKSNYDDNIYETEDGEEWFIGDKKQALGYAWEQVDSLIDSMGIEGFSPDFQDWIIENAVDDDFIQRLQREEADYYRQDGDEEFASWINNMTVGQFKNHIIDNYGPSEFYDLVTKNQAFNKDRIIREVINLDGIASQLATYDGKEIELPNGLLAYRLN